MDADLDLLLIRWFTARPMISCLPDQEERTAKDL